MKVDGWGFTRAFFGFWGGGKGQFFFFLKTSPNNWQIEICMYVHVPIYSKQASKQQKRSGK